MQNNVLNVLILSRRLGSDDESATLIEQNERLLLYIDKDIIYNNKNKNNLDINNDDNDTNNDDNELLSRLNKLSLVESLIDFSDKFSSEPIDVVILENKTMAYLKAEPDLWIVITVSNTNYNNDTKTKIDNNNNNSNNNNNTNGSGLIDLLKLMYRSFSTFYGNINKLLGGSKGLGWKTIKKVQEMRKCIRKLERDIIQAEEDYESLTRVRDNEDNEEESFGIRQGTININELKSDIINKKQTLIVYNNELKCLLEQKQYCYNKEDDGNNDQYDYTPKYTKIILRHFFLWYIRTGEVSYPSALHGMTGIHYFPVGHPSFGFLLR